MQQYTIGATGRGSVTLGGATSTHIVTDASAGNARYRYDNGVWKLALAADKSRAQGGYRDQSEGHFRQMAISLRNPARLEYRAARYTLMPSLQSCQSSYSGLTKRSYAISSFLERVNPGVT